MIKVLLALLFPLVLTMLLERRRERKRWKPYEVVKQEMIQELIDKYELNTDDVLCIIAPDMHIYNWISEANWKG